MSYRRVVLSMLAGLALVGVAPPGWADDAPIDVRARIGAAGNAEDYSADAVVVLDHTNVRVRPNGIGTARRHLVTKILRDGAIRSEAVQVFPFDPNTNRLDLIAVRVYRADGEVVEIPLDTKVLQPEAAGSIFWGTKQYLVQLPRLEIGDAVETLRDMTGFNVAYLGAAGDTATPPEANFFGEELKPPVDGHWHDEVHFWTTGFPVLEKKYTVRLPRDKPLQFGMYNGEITPEVMFDGDDLVYSFVKHDLEPLDSEPHMEPWPNVAPKLLLATLPTWEDKARWLYEVSEPHFPANDDIRAKVMEIIDGLETDEEKYTALNHWVAENIRYAGTSRGMCEGYTVHPSVETFRDRAGVCKDKAGMLVTMLRVAGYDSFLVMTMARQRVDPVPADQFNHAVTCIRWPDGSLTLLDPTWMPRSRDNWSKLEPLQHVVYGLPEGKELSQSPYFPPEDSQAVWKAESRIDGLNTLTGAVDFMATGAPEGRVRRALGELHPADRSAWFDDTFQRLSPNARVSRVRAMDPVDFSGPLSIQCDYMAEGYALGHGERRRFRLPMLQTPFGNRALYDLFWESPDERQYGLKLLATRHGRFEETLQLPPGWKPVDLPEAVEIDGPAAALRFSIEFMAGKLHYTCDLIVKRWLIPPDEFANYKEVMDKFRELANLMIAYEMEGGHATR